MQVGRKGGRGKEASAKARGGEEGEWRREEGEGRTRACSKTAASVLSPTNRHSKNQSREEEWARRRGREETRDQRMSAEKSKSKSKQLIRPKVQPMRGTFIHRNDERTVLGGNGVGVVPLWDGSASGEGSEVGKARESRRGRLVSSCEAEERGRPTSRSLVALLVGRACQLSSAPLLQLARREGKSEAIEPSYLTSSSNPPPPNTYHPQARKFFHPD